MHFVDIPEDVLYLILDGLGVEDAVALELTCRTLNALAKTTQFWLIIAKSLSIQHPLPLPPFHVSLHALSRLELKKTCVRHQQTTKNFHSLTPQVIKRRTLVLSGDQDVYHFAFLPGGRYAITILLDGTFSCWDYSNATYRPSSRVESEPNLSLSEENLLLDEPLAKYHAHQKPISWNFQSFPDRSEVLVSILTGEGEHWDDSRNINVQVHTLQLSFLPDGGLQIELLALDKIPFPCTRISIQNEVVCVNGVLDRTVFLFLNDWKANLACVINTTIQKDCWKFDSLVVNGNSILLFHETGREAVIHQYLNLQDLIHKHGTTPPSLPTSVHNIITLQPDISKRIPFEVPDLLPSATPSSSSPTQIENANYSSNNYWFTAHPWNTPNPAFMRPVSIVSTSRGVIPVNDEGEFEFNENTILGGIRGTRFRTLTHHWFDPFLLSSAPSSSSEDDEEGAVPNSSNLVVPGFCRWVHHIPDVICTGIVSSELVCTGSEGTHLFWLCDSGPSGGGPKIRLALLPSPEETTHSTEVPSQHRVRDLDLGPDLDLFDISTMDLDDAHGVFGLGMRRDGKEQRIHMLYY